MNTLDSSVSYPMSPAACVSPVATTEASAPITAASPFDYDPFVADYAASAAARAALTESEILPVNLDVQLVVPVVLRAAARVQPYRGAIAEQLPKFDLARFDQLVPLAQALAYAHSLFLSANMPPQDLPRLFARAVELREVLVLDVTGLVKRHLLTGDPLSELRGVVGYANVASDLRVLTNIYQANWSAIVGKTAVQSSELNEAAALFRQITQAIAARAEQPAVVSAAGLERQRAFTLLVRAYEDARRAITYLRSEEGDADKLVPSMWARRNRRPASSASDSDAHEDDAPIAAPSAEPAVSPAPHAAPVAPGMPGGSPFIDS